MMELIESIENLLKENFPDSEVMVENLGGNHPHDLTGTQSHIGITVRSNLFENMPLVKQHQMIMDLIKTRFDQDLHAVKIKTQKL